MPKSNILEQALPGGLRDREIAEGQKSFWKFCQLNNNDFYKDSRPHLRELCDTLQALYEGKLLAPDGTPCRRLAISEPPRHGKSYTMCLFNEWVLGKDAKRKIIDVSYNRQLSIRFGKTVRDGISATRIDPKYKVFSDFFPGIRIKDGDASMEMWSLEGSYFTFLATSFGSTVTGVGCTIMIIDDPIKDKSEAYNDRILQEKWDYFRDTLKSRIENDGILIVVMTRWATKDLVGMFLSKEPKKWYVLNQKACLDEKKGTMLCPELLTYETWLENKALMSEEIFEANYQNQPIDKKGRLYTEFATYDQMPVDAANKPLPSRKISYTDTADTGADFLCHIAADVIEGRGYITDIIYTDEPMEKTEPMVARSLFDQGTLDAVVESNNGGRGFGRNVTRILWDTFRSRKAKVIDLNQRSNKESRILSESTWVMRNLLLPEDWMDRWPKFAEAMINYKRKGKNEHDDAPDAMTGLAEYIQHGASRRKKFFSGRGAC